MRIKALVAGIIAALATTVTSTSAGAQLPGLTGAADVGLRNFTREPSIPDRGKLDQYRDLSACAVKTSSDYCPALDALLLKWSPADSFRTVQFVGHNVGKQDQSLWLRATQPGMFDAQLRWDRILHTFSTNGRSLGTATSPGVYTLPSPRPDTATWNRNLSYLDPIRTRWDPVKLSLALTPTSHWDFKTEYTRTGKTGERPMGMAFGGPSNNAREILEPIDQTLHDVKVSQSYAADRFQIVGMYNLSVFHNALESVTSDNPLNAVDAATTGGARGRTSLAPSNIAHTVTSTGALNLPFRTRVSGTASYGWWRQDAQFIAPTINGAIVDPRVPTVSNAIGSNLHGDVQTSLVNVSATSRPLPALTFTARYRTYDFRDHTPIIHVPVLVINDRSLQNADSTEQYPFTKNNADASVSWRPIVPLSLSAAYAWEQMDRDTTVRNVARVTEKTPRASVDFSGVDWLTLRATYSKGWRRGSAYHQLATSENPTSRRFDEADRDRERVNFLAQITPFDQLGITGTWEIGHDEYLNSAFGLQSDRSAAVGGDIDWTPSSRFSLGGGYVRELFLDRQRNQYRSGSTPATLANPSWVWIGNNQDRNSTASANFTAVLIPDKFEIGGNFEISYSRFIMLATNPLTPTGGTAAQNLSATAFNFPEVTEKLQPLTLYLRHMVTPNWAMTIRYTGEIYNQNDFRTLNLSPATGNYIFLGNNLANYDARFITLMMSYRPGLLRLGRSTL